MYPNQSETRACSSRAGTPSSQNRSSRIVVINTSDRMHGMIQMEARLFDFFSVTPVFRTESMLLLKFTCIFLKALSRKQSFSIFTSRALVRNRTLMISCLCNVLFTGPQHDTTLDSLTALDREISLKKHTSIHTYIQT